MHTAYFSINSVNSQRPIRCVKPRQHTMHVALERNHNQSIALLDTVTKMFPVRHLTFFKMLLRSVHTRSRNFVLAHLAVKDILGHCSVIGSR